MELYAKYGYVYDKTVAISYSGLNAMKDMNLAVDKMKTLTISEIGGIKVDAVRDYSSLIRKTANGEQQKIDSDSCNAIYFELENGGFICLRPSGTEPKLKIYYSLRAENKAQAEQLFEKVKLDFENIMKQQ